MPEILDYASPNLNRRNPRKVYNLGRPLSVMQTICWICWLYAIQGDVRSRGQNWYDRLAGDVTQEGVSFAVFGVVASLIALVAVYRPVAGRKRWHQAYFACLALWVLTLLISMYERSVSLSDYLYPYGPAMDLWQLGEVLLITQPVAFVLFARMVKGNVDKIG
jgi:hypothetical protein